MQLYPPHLPCPKSFSGVSKEPTKRTVTLGSWTRTFVRRPTGHSQAREDLPVPQPTLCVKAVSCHILEHLVSGVRGAVEGRRTELPIHLGKVVF